MVLRYRRSLGAALLLWMLAGAALGQQASYTFGVVPQQAASQMAADWMPVLRALSLASGVQITFATAPDVPTFERRLAAGAYDFAYMNPYHFTVYNQRPGYRALVRAKGERLRAVVLVRNDSRMHSLRDLAGATLAFPSPAAFGATLLVQAELRRQQIPFHSVYVKSHNSVYRDVAMGLFAAGGGVPRTFDLLDTVVARELRVLWASPAYTSHAIATRPQLDPDVRNRVQAAMLRMNRDPAQLRLLAEIGFEGFESAQDQDWDDVRRLAIKPGDAGIQE